MTLNPQDDPTAPMTPDDAPPSPYAAQAGPYAPYWPAPQPQPEPAPRRGWQAPAWLPPAILFVLAPAVGEMLGGATPPVRFFTPGTFLFLAALYGTSAVLARETVRRRGLGWGALILFGAAFGVLNEGIIAQTWFNPQAQPVLYLDGYSRALGLNWFFALGLLAYHATISIALPVIFVEALFPAQAERPWLGRRWYRALLALLGLTGVVETVAIATLYHQATGYMPPALGLLFALLVGSLLVWLGLRWPLWSLGRAGQGIASQPPPLSPRPAPSLSMLRVAGFGFTLALFAVLWILPHVVRNAIAGVAIEAAAIGVVAWVIARWSRRADWAARSRLALATGVVLFFVALSPLIEFGVGRSGSEAGMLLMAPVWLAGVIALTIYARRAEERRVAHA